MTLIRDLRHHITRRHLNPPLGFVHIPKAAGTALIDRLDANLRPRKYVYGLDRSQFGSFSAFHTMAPSARASIFLNSSDIPDNADIIAGHLSPKSIRDRYPDAHLLTVLRAPAPRLLSHWFYWRGYSDNVLALYGSWGNAIAGARLGLADFLENRELACVTDNIILRMLLWPHPLIPSNNFIDPANDAVLLSAARLVLADFSFVGIVESSKSKEDLDKWLQYTYGVSFWTYLRRRIPENISSKENKSKIPLVKMNIKLSEEVRSVAGVLLHDRSRLDNFLWNTVAEKFFTALEADRLYNDSFIQNIVRYENLDSQL